MHSLFDGCLLETFLHVHVRLGTLYISTDEDSGKIFLSDPRLPTLYAADAKRDKACTDFDLFTKYVSMHDLRRLDKKTID